MLRYLTIRIIEPITSLDLAAFSYISGHENASQFFDVNSIASKSTNLYALEEFVERYYGTAYGDYAAYSLGEYYFARHDYIKASEKFSKVAVKKDFVFGEKVKNYIEKAKKHLQNLDGTLN